MKTNLNLDITQGGRRLIILLSLSLSLSTTSIAQSTLETVVGVELINGTFEDLIGHLQYGDLEGEGVYFSYPSEIIPDKRVTLEEDPISLKDLLDAFLGPGYTYIERGRYIIIQKEKENKPSGEEVRFRGQLKDHRSGEVVANATIYEVNSLRAAQTDSLGRFDFSVPGRSRYVELAISKEDYHDVVVRVYNSDSIIGDLDYKLMSNFEVFEESDADDLKIVKRLVSEENLINMKNVSLYEKRFAQVSFLPFVGTNTRMSGKVSNNLSLNILAGYSHSLKGIEVGGLVNIQRKDVDGLQISGGANINGGRMRGVQISGIDNTSMWNASGIQCTGMFNWCMGTMRGLQVSGITNYTIAGYGLQVSGVLNGALEQFTGVQLAGLVNGGWEYNGIQAAGLVNFAGEYLNGLQVAGLFNAAHNVNGLQVASLGNYTTKRLNGVQIGTLLNGCGTLNGLQIGLVNFCDTVESGANIGLLSFVRRGMHTLQYHYNEIAPVNVSFKTGTNQFYNIVSVASRLDSVNMFGYGFGSQRRYDNGLFRGAEFQVFSVHGSELEQKSVNLLAQLTPFIGYRIWKHAGLSVGPVLNAYYRFNIDDSGELDSYGLLPSTFYDAVDQSGRLQMSFGFRAAFVL